MAYRIGRRKNIGIVCCVNICQDLVNYHLEKCHFELHSQSKQVTEQMTTLTLTNLIKCLYLFKPIQQTDICWYQKRCGGPGSHIEFLSKDCHKPHNQYNAAKVCQILFQPIWKGIGFHYKLSDKWGNKDKRPSYWEASKYYQADFFR